MVDLFIDGITKTYYAFNISWTGLITYYLCVDCDFEGYDVRYVEIFASLAFRVGAVTAAAFVSVNCILNTGLWMSFLKGDGCSL